MNYSKRRKKSSNSSFSRNRSSTHFAKRANNRRRKVASNLDPNTLIQKAKGTAPEPFVPTRTFDEMHINPKLKANLGKMGFSYPTHIQENTIEHLITGRDLVGVASTGTGKTAAFLIPIIELSIDTPQAPTSLVVVPTRELALQVKQEFQNLTHGLGLRAASFIGGTSVVRDLKQLRRHNDIIIGTPGRLMDLSNRGALRLQDISVLVLDEFDRMLDMGFVEDIMSMVKLMESRKQTMLFSATLDRNQNSLINGLLNDHIEVKVSSGAPANDIEQDVIRVAQGGDKFTMLLDLIAHEEFEKVLLFTETKKSVDRISKRLKQSGIRADLIHGDKSQNYRNNALDKFKRGRVQVLVATDVAARGIDVFNVTHVINYQLPKSLESYVHRIGRTGRAGKTGKALTFVD